MKLPQQEHSVVGTYTRHVVTLAGVTHEANYESGSVIFLKLLRLFMDRESFVPGVIKLFSPCLYAIDMRPQV